MTLKEKQNYIAPILENIHVSLYGHSTMINHRIGWSLASHRASIRVHVNHLEEALEMLEMENMAFEINKDQYINGLIDIIVFYG